MEFYNLQMRSLKDSLHSCHTVKGLLQLANPLRIIHEVTVFIF